MKIFSDPIAHTAYLHSEEFGTDIMNISEILNGFFEEEPRCLNISSPVYVFGDIHGNLEDLHFFSDKENWKLKLKRLFKIFELTAKIIRKIN